MSATTGEIYVVGLGMCLNSGQEARFKSNGVVPHVGIFVPCKGYRESYFEPALNEKLEEYYSKISKTSESGYIKSKGHFYYSCLL